MTKENSIKTSYMLSDLYDLQMGKTPARDKSEYWKNGQYDWASIADLSKCGKYIDATKEKITKKAVDESGIKIIPANTVIMSFKLSIGKVAITKKPLYSNEAIMAFMDKKIVPISTQYAYYMLSAQSWNQGLNQAVKGITLNKNSLSQYRVYIHDENMQEHIVMRLNKLSDIIELRKIQLEKLDLLVKAKFYEMFGDTKKGNMRGELVPIGTVAKELFAGGDKPSDFSTTQTAEYPYPVFSNGERDNGLLCFSHAYRVGEKAITISARGTIGYITIREPFFTPVVRLITFIPNDNTNIVYLKHCFMQLELSQTGTSQGQLTVPDFKKAIIPLPPLELQNEFAHFVEQTEKIKTKIKGSLEKLELLKQSLLQKYFG